MLHRTRQDVERINYDSGINGRLIVNGLGGNDIFAVDDNSAITTLDGGAGDDTFLLRPGVLLAARAGEHASGQRQRCSRRDASRSARRTSTPLDAFPTTDTTIGWLSRGNSFPIVAYGGTGNDAFLVLSNHAPLTLDGGDGNDLFALKTSALVNPFTNSVLVDTFLTPADPATGAQTRMRCRATRSTQPSTRSRARATTRSTSSGRVSATTSSRRTPGRSSAPACT